MDISLIISMFFNIILMLMIGLLIISNSIWSRDAGIYKEEICNCKIIIAELKSELKFMKG